MMTYPNNKKTAEQMLDIWVTMIPIIQMRLSEKSSFYNYLARLDFMLLKHRISLKRLTTLPYESQQALSEILAQVKVALQSSHTDSKLLSEYLERINLILD